MLAAGTVLLADQCGGWNTLTGKAWAIACEVKAQPGEEVGCETVTAT